MDSVQKIQIKSQIGAHMFAALNHNLMSTNTFNLSAYLLSSNNKKNKLYLLLSKTLKTHKGASKVEFYGYNIFRGTL